jgi:hypothetical protein
MTNLTGILWVQELLSGERKDEGAGRSRRRERVRLAAAAAVAESESPLCRRRESAEGTIDSRSSWAEVDHRPATVRHWPDSLVHLPFLTGSRDPSRLSDIASRATTRK